MNTKDDEENLTGLKRILAVVVALALWWMSMTFSVKGFVSFNQNPNPDDAWIGWTLAGCVTAFELIWNGMKERTNLTMWVVGMLAYAYGITTNVIGIAEWMGIGFTLWFVFPVLLGLVIEIAPEPAFIWGVTGNYKGGDFLGNLFGNKIPIAPKHSSWGGQNTSTSPYSRPMPVSTPKPSFNRPQPTSPYKPQHKPQSFVISPQRPKLRNFNTDPMDEYEEPRF